MKVHANVISDTEKVIVETKRIQTLMLTSKFRYLEFHSYV